MNLLTNPNTQALWQDVIKKAEHQCAIRLQGALERYLISLLMNFSINHIQLISLNIHIVCYDSISSQLHIDCLRGL